MKLERVEKNEVIEKLMINEVKKDLTVEKKEMEMMSYGCRDE